MLSSEITAILDKIAGKSKVTALRGTFVSYDATGVLVDVGDGRLPAALGSGYLPEVGESVLVWFVDGIPYVMGPVSPRPHKGTVTAVGSGLVTLSTPAGIVGPIPYSGSVPSVGATMRLFWNGGPLAFTATPAGGEVVPGDPGGGAATTHVDTFVPIAAGTWNTGGGDSATSYFNAEVWASNTTIGAWFYGTKTQDTIPGSAAVQRVQLYISARQIQGSAPIFTVHGHGAPPLAALSGGVATAVANGAWVDLPVSFGNALRRGGTAYGIGTRHGGYNIFKSLAADPQSGLLRITSVY